MKKILLTALLASGLCANFVHAGDIKLGPVEALEKAVQAEKGKLAQQNAFASSSGLCIGGVGVLSSGPVAFPSLRMCTYRYFSRSDIASLMQKGNWPLSFQGTNVEYYKHPNGWYMTVYDKSGNASEIVALLDSTTD